MATLSWFHIASLLGAFQGGLLAVVLATQRRNRTANRLLAFAMLAFSIGMISTVYYGVGFERVFPHFFGVSYPLPFVYGPLIYLYAVTASDRTRRFTWRDGLHFVPVAAVVLSSAPIYLMTGAEKIAFYQDLQRGIVPLQIRISDPLKFVSGVSYTAATLLFLRRHRAHVKDSYSSLERVNLEWLVRLAIASAIIWGIATAFEMVQGMNNPLVAHAEDIVSLGVAVVVYGTGYMALRQPEIFNYAAVDHVVHHSAEPPTEPPKAIPETVAPPSEAFADATAPRYERSGLSDREAASLQRALIAAMETEQRYKDSSLTLADLAERLDTSPHKLSEVLNSQLKQTFYDFVNGYRVKDVQRRIASDDVKNLKILALAMDAGFASKSTFNHVFRQHTGHTPSAYRKSLSA